MGKFISPVLQGAGYFYQFAEKGILIYDSQSPFIQRLRLYSAGLDMGFDDPPEPLPADPNIPYLNGHVVWSEVIPFLDKLGNVCKPLSTFHFNSELKRYEQFFDCLGFYRMENEAQGTIHLLDYGAWECGEACSADYTPTSGFIPQNLFPEQPSKEELRNVEAYIVEAADRIRRTITGNPLTPTFLSQDGKYYVKVYEYVVLACDVDNPARVYVLPIHLSLNMLSGVPAQKIDEPGVYFFPVRDDVGYSVRSYLVDYIILHGGIDTSGLPISNEYHLSNTVTRQCFEKLCLDYHVNSPDTLKIRPAPLGYVYKELYYQQEVQQPTPTPSVDTVGVLTWERYPLISSDQSQEIGVAVYENYVPVQDVRIVLNVTMPDGSMREYNPPPTDNNGQTFYRLDPIQADNGTIILYQVCVRSVGGAKNFCDMEDFTIWGNP